jgi:hypothetical protein
VIGNALSTAAVSKWEGELVGPVDLDNTFEAWEGGNQTNA